MTQTTQLFNQCVADDIFPTILPSTPRSTLSSSVVIISRQPSSSSSKINNCSFRYASHLLLHFGLSALGSYV